MKTTLYVAVKQRLLYAFLGLSVALLVVLAKAEAAELDPKLAVFASYLGTWQATMSSDEGKPDMIDVTRWQRALNGKAIRTLHSINDGMYGGESLIFWDKNKQQLVFYYFTTADFYTQGYIEVIDESHFVAYEKVSGNKDGITKVRSTSALLNDSIRVTTSYFKHGAWTEADSRTYYRSDKEVVFK